MLVTNVTKGVMIASHDSDANMTEIGFFLNGSSDNVTPSQKFVDIVKNAFPDYGSDWANQEGS